MKVTDPEIIDTVKSLHIPLEGYAVFGSALLEVLGIRKSNDIDLLVSKQLFDELEKTPEWNKFTYDNGDVALKNHSDDKPIVAFYSCVWIPSCSEGEVLQMIKNSIIIDNVNFVSLENTLKWKARLARDKDLKDVELIKNYLRKSSQ